MANYVSVGKPSAAAKKRPASTGTRHATGHCKGECRLRTKGMKVGDVRRRIHGAKKLKIIRVA